MNNIDETYCIGCGSELKLTSYEPLAAETYYICPGCNLEYTVTITDDYTIIAEIDTTNK